MSLIDSSPRRTRLVICVDGTWCREDGSGTVSGNQTNIFRIYASVSRTGNYHDESTGITYEQRAKYFAGLGADKDVTLGMKFIAGAFGKGVSKKIQEVYQQCCELEAEDEVWLYGFSRGAFVVRAVAGLLHHIRALKAKDEDFEKDYKRALKIYGSIRRSSEEHGEIYGFVAEKTRPAPTVKFVGVFDTVKALRDEQLHDISFTVNIRHMRHALALHEDRRDFEPECIYPNFKNLSESLGSRSLVQAWFVGAHMDMGGSTRSDGLSLYPLQWMLDESARCGLKLGFMKLTKLDNPLDLTFPFDPNIVHHSDTPSLTIIAFRGRYHIRLNRARSGLWIHKKRMIFNEYQLLKGWNDKLPQGTVIHPSVYFILNEYSISLVTMDEHEKALMANLQREEPRMLGIVGDLQSGRITVDHGFWAVDGAESTADRQFPVRILICGNVGVGKSSLINKVFGVPVADPSDRKSGQHDILKEYTWDERPDLVVHDSRGFEAASESEMNIVRDFLHKMSSKNQPEERLHIIWFCIDTSDDRPMQQSTKNLFQAISQYAHQVPVVIVATKRDRFIAHRQIQKQMELQSQGHAFDQELHEKAVKYAAQELIERVNLIETEMHELNGPDTRCQLELCVSVAQDDIESIKQLTRETIHCIDSDAVRTACIAAQVNDIDAKIDKAVQSVLKEYRKILGSAAGSGFVPSGATIERGAAAIAACKTIKNAFGLPTVGATTAFEILKTNVWDDMGHNFMIGLAEGLSVLGTGGTVCSGGMPFFLVTGTINLALVVPATTRLYLILACDLILILIRCFTEPCDANAGQPRTQDLQLHAREYGLSGMAKDVHRRVKQLIPKRYLFSSFRADKIGKGVEQIIKDFREEILQQSKSASTDSPIHAMAGAQSKQMASSVSQLHEEEDLLDDIREEAAKEDVKEEAARKDIKEEAAREDMKGLSLSPQISMVSETLSDKTMVD